MKGAIATGGGWYQVPSRRQRREHAYYHAWGSGARRHHRQGSFSRHRPSLTTEGHPSSFFPRRTAKYEHHGHLSATGKFLNNSYYVRNLENSVNHIKNAGTIPVFFPNPSTHEFMNINGNTKANSITNSDHNYFLHHNIKPSLSTTNRPLMAYACQTRFDPMVPRGNVGDSELPPNLPKFAMVFIPETEHMRHHTLELNRSIVIDTRLRSNHSTNKIQSALMMTRNSDYPYPLTHMSGAQYLLGLWGRTVMHLSNDSLNHYKNLPMSFIREE